MLLDIIIYYCLVVPLIQQHAMLHGSVVFKKMVMCDRKHTRVHWKPINFE